MSNFSDTLTVGLILLLVFGSVTIYLYTRIQQSEQKINLLETILLDIKVSNEIKLYSDLPVENQEDNQYIPYHEEKTQEPHDIEIKVEALNTTSLTNSIEIEEESDSINYNTMTVKELQSLAVNKGIEGTNKLKKSVLIDLLQNNEKTGSNVMGTMLLSTNSLSSNSLVDNSYNISNDTIE